MTISFDSLLVPWDISQWAADKKSAAARVTTAKTDSDLASDRQRLKGLLLTHTDPSKIYLAPNPDKIALVIEIEKSDVEELEAVSGEDFVHSETRRTPLSLITLKPDAIAFPVLAVPKSRLPGLIDGMSGSNPKDPKEPKDPICPSGVRGGITDKA